MKLPEKQISPFLRKTPIPLNIDQVQINYSNISLFPPCRSSQSAFYKVLISNAATSALRLHQRLPNIQFTREFLSLLLLEDSCHYLFFSLIYLYVQPFVLILFPVVLFAVLHSASYSLKMLDVSIKMTSLFSKAMR